MRLHVDGALRFDVIAGLTTAAVVACTRCSPLPSNLITDPKERESYNPVYLYTWTFVHFGKLMKEFAASVRREPLIPAGAPLDFVPKAARE